MTTLVLDILDTNIKYGIGGLKNYKVVPIFDTVEYHIENLLELCDNKIEKVIICESIQYIKNKRQIDKCISNFGAKVYSYDKSLLALYGLGRDVGMVVYADSVWKVATFYNSYRLENTVKYFNYKSVDRLARIIHKNIKRVDIDLRKKIAKNIIIVGNYPNNKIGEKLIEYLDKKYYYIIYTPKENEDLAWIGGSIVSQLDFFKNIK